MSQVLQCYLNLCYMTCFIVTWFKKRHYNIICSISFCNLNLPSYLVFFHYLLLQNEIVTLSIITLHSQLFFYQISVFLLLFVFAKCKMQLQHYLLLHFIFNFSFMVNIISLKFIFLFLFFYYTSFWTFLHVGYNLINYLYDSFGF